MTTPTINLAHLRERAESAAQEWADWRQGHDHPDTPATPDEVLALIDTAEAAIAFFEDEPERVPHYRWFAETLNRFTIDQPQ